MADKVNPRELILEILMDIDKNGSYSHMAINSTLKKYQFLDKQTRSFIQRICEGTIEYGILIDYIIDQFSKTKVKKMKPVIRTILRMTTYQIKFMDGVPDSAACNEAVILAKKKGFKNLSGFVNGVLRGIIRGMDEISYPDEEKDPVLYLSILYSMPEWIIKDWLLEYDYNTVKKMVSAALLDSATTIRCNESKSSIDKLKLALEEEDIQVTCGTYMSNALKISGYNYLGRVNAFKEGLFQVQDESSMLVGRLSNIKEGDRVIDVCAAPGGKTFHVADLLKGTGCVISRDLTEFKVDMIHDNLERLAYTNVVVEQQDALELLEESVASADVVLADLPCSGLGIMGKKNDIKYKISKEAQEELVVLQRSILNVVHQYVKPGGILMYSTCTINPAENQKNVEWMIQNYPFVLDNITDDLPESLKSSVEKEGMIQLLPGIHQCDGFFIAKLRRI